MKEAEIERRHRISNFRKNVLEVVVVVAQRVGSEAVRKATRNDFSEKFGISNLGIEICLGENYFEEGRLV